MNALYRPISIALLAGVLVLPFHAHGAGNDKATLQDLMAEGADLNKSLVKATVVKKKLDQTDQELKGSQAAIDSAKRQLKQASIKLQLEGESHDQQAKMQISRGCGVGGSSPDKAWVAACNGEVARLNDWLAKIDANADGLKAYGQKITEEQAQLSDTLQLWTKKRKQNDADLNDINAALTDWSQRYNAFVFNSPTYDRLVHTDIGMQQCAQLGPNPSEGEMEVAHRCLQWLWDGATPP